ncbi:unnamed protein product [Rotaria socialis]|uniref:RanBP2-type domain-containing protein n=1 Tax=Rotaria socialis TaxID=392032 RepID=A0A821LRN6_9BILA|nr:unnamed protein product [Rotaria socialis]CAF4754712.1 unnamed protein product [Rotaria socialis]
MDWTCSECTYTNSSEDKICVVCEDGYRFFSVDSNENSSQNMDDNVDSNDSVITLNNKANEQEQENLSSTSVAREHDEDDNLLGRTIDNRKKIDQFRFNVGAICYRKDIYVREDGEVLYGQQAIDERKRSIARRKALDLQKLLEKSSDKLDSKRQNSLSTFSTNTLKTSATDATKTSFTSTSAGHFNALTAHAKVANVSATATAEIATVSTGNAFATGANASASASSSVVRVNTLNTTATGVNTSISATADGLKVAAGNVSVTGAETTASVSASAAKVIVGNVDVTGASAGASASVNGAGVSAFNVSIGGASAAASVNVDGSLSFGNVNLGLRPSLDIGLGLNIGIPFLSGSRVGSAGGGNNNGDECNDEKVHGLEGCQKYLSEKFPNQRHYVKAAEFSVDPNTTGEAIDPTLTDKRLERDNGDNSAVENVIGRHEKLVEEGNKFVGFKGGPKRDNTTNEQSSSEPAAPSTIINSDSGSVTVPSKNEWSGMYTSPSPAVAAGYAIDDQGRPGVIDRVYLPKGAADMYHTSTGLNTREGTEALKQVRQHSNERYIFSGPQHATDPDLRPPETVISPAVRDEALAAGNIRFEPSAHGINRQSYQMDTVYERELESSRIVPDYMVNMTKGPADCERDGGRERLGHVFQGRPPYGYETVPLKTKELSDDDKLLLEECRKLGFEIPPGSLDEWVKKLRSDEEYEREEDVKNRRAQSNNNGNSEKFMTKQDKEESEEENEPLKPCKDHPINVRCMKCISGSSEPRVRQLHGRIHGFKFNN